MNSVSGEHRTLREQGDKQYKKSSNVRALKHRKDFFAHSVEKLPI